MHRNDILTKVLAVIGTILVWFPILATVLTGVFTSLRSGRFHVDFLMPAELFPFALGGGLLLLWAALRLRSRREVIGWSLVAMLVFPAAGTLLASVTGLASGETEPVGLPWALVLAALVAYTLAVAAAGVGGGLLLRDLFGHHGKDSAPAVPVV